jgi:ATP-dependent protease HslVU (ClpYQ) peptidase subunit
VTPISDFFVSGSGGKIALGAIEALKSEHPEAWESQHDIISKKAIEAACKFDLYSSGAIRGFKSLPNGKITPLN